MVSLDFLWGLKELIYVKLLGQYLAQAKQNILIVIIIIKFHGMLFCRTLQFGIRCEGLIE